MQTTLEQLEQFARTAIYWPANAAMVTSQSSQQNSDDAEEEDGEGEGDVKPESDGRVASAAAANATNTLKQHSSRTPATQWDFGTFCGGITTKKGKTHKLLNLI